MCTSLCRCDASMNPVVVDCSSEELQFLFRSDAEEWEFDQDEAPELVLDLASPHSEKASFSLRHFRKCTSAWSHPTFSV